MLIILILFILTVIFITVGVILIHTDEWYEWGVAPFVAGALVSCILVILSIACIDSYICKDLIVEQYLMKYEILQEQLSNEFYKTEYLDQRQKLMEDILEYNSDVMNGRFKSKTLWLNWFYPEDWDSIPLIEFSKEEGTE